MRVRTRGRKRPERTRRPGFPAQRPSYWPTVPLDFSRPRPATPRPRMARLEAGVSAGENHKCGGLTATGLRLLRYEYAEQRPSTKQQEKATPVALLQQPVRGCCNRETTKELLRSRSEAKRDR